MKKIWLVFVGVSILTRVSIAQEGPQLFRDWAFERKVIDGLGDTCVAYTDKRTDQRVGDANWRLSIQYSVQKKRPASIFITSLDNTLVNPVIYSQTDSSQNIQKHFRSEFLDVSMGAPTYWFAPQKFNDFYRYIRRGTSLKVKYVQEVEKQLNFSLMGSTAATNKISELCNGKKDFLPETFYSFIDQLNVSHIPPMSNASVHTGWEELGESWGFYLESGALESDVQKVQSEIDTLVAQERAYLKQEGLLSSEIEDLEKEKADLEVLIVSQQNQLKSTEQNLSLEESRLQASLLILNEKEIAFRPVREEARPYFVAVENAQNRIYYLKGQIDQTQEEIRKLKNDLNGFWSEASLLESRIFNQKQELAQLRQDRNQAQNKYLAYNVESEYQRKLQTDAVYQQKLSSKEQSDRDLASKKQRVEKRQQEVRQAEQDLANCEAVPTNNCNAYKQALREKKTQLSTAKNQYQQEVAKNSQLSQDIQNRKQQLRALVQNEKQRLANVVAKLDRDISQLQVSINQNEYRLSHVRNTEIPRTERELSSVESRLGSQQNQLEIAKGTLSQAEQELASFKIRSDYDRKEREFLVADRNVKDIRISVAALEAKIDSLKEAIAKNEARVLSLNAQIEKHVSALASNQEALQEVQVELQRLREERVQLQTKLSDVQEDMKVSGESFRVNIRDLPVQKNSVPVFPPEFRDWL